MMQLLDHLKETGEGVTAFADRIGAKRTTIRKIAYRQRQPSLTLAAKIGVETGGAVTFEDLMVPRVSKAAA